MNFKVDINNFNIIPSGYLMEQNKTYTTTKDIH